MQNEIETIRYLIDRYVTHPAVVVEAGCYDGMITLTLHEIVKKKLGRYIALECDPRSIHKIRCNQYFPSDVFLVEKAIADHDGTATLHISDGVSQDKFVYDCSSSILPPADVKEDWPEIRFEQSIEVPCITLDTLAKEHSIQHIDLIWADIQGAEAQMISGGSEILKHTKFLYLEHSGEREWYKGQWNLQQMIDELSKLDFGVYKQFTFDILFYNQKLITL